ncbi:Eco57I restriction-modification methylase domain-containing protein [Sporolactobacillus spathodeae]|uniref:Superfamily II DNA or RNA helicase n=1 Tax=Sporolactobacillus spathodeae TaxID=1465502 RepID=A0ABS2Q9W5_9BACL|nr:Eco57I restriction-modification methylase domain-containing protein [Sporolactobacillus spathodeae]MBM7658456.1 superfamily II DNA or RNA helicase [Sporolactobacillus spathodeae]
MSRNFEYLKLNEDSANYFPVAETAERQFASAEYASELTTARKIAENISKFVLDQNYMHDNETFSQNLLEIKHHNLLHTRILDLLYAIKRAGNSATHTLNQFSRDEGLKVLRQLADLLYWFAERYCDYTGAQPIFTEPVVEQPYTTFDRKVIYVQTGDNISGKWPAYVGREKIGEATVDGYETDLTKNSPDLREASEARIRTYMGTSAVPFKLEWAELAYRKDKHVWFSDHDVHRVLDRSGIKRDPELTENGGREWFITNVNTVKCAIAAVKEGREYINAPVTNTNAKLILRPEQIEAVARTKKVFKHYNRMLWNAKMRFGKTLSALKLIRDEQYAKVLIMTHRPVVNNSWFNDFKKLDMASAGYMYGSKTKGASLDKLFQADQPFIYFASIQDLRSSKTFGGKVKDKNRLVKEVDWSLVIIDEAHEGTQTEPAQRVIAGVTKSKTRLLELSGTPFNLIDQYNPEQVYTWDYVMEQQAKVKWTSEHPDKANPYLVLPKVSMYTFEMKKRFADSRFLDIDQRSFNFHEFFKVNEDGQFVYESKINQFLNNITTPSKETSFPFSTKEFREKLRHTLWLMPSVAAAKAMKALMERHPIFGFDYKIVNVVDNGDALEANDGDLERVRKAITDHPARTKTITLTVRKLTTGVNIPEWTGIIFLSNTNSAMQYLQAAFRAQTPYADEELGMKKNCYIFDFAPDRALTVIAESTRLNTGAGKLQTHDQQLKMGELLNFLPIIGEQGQGMQPYKVDSLLTQLKRVYAERAVRSGFDDDSLYSDELLKLDEADVSKFNDLKAIVGTTKAEKKKVIIDVNSQGLTDEEYDKATKAEKKPNKERSAEEQELLDRMRRLKKQRKTMISILRSISIRIPMMIYGMAIDIGKDVDIPTFIRLVDDRSWEEFMPKGVTKVKFRQFAKYYDSQIFIEAGRIIRQRVRRLDKLEPFERTAEIAAIFGTFKNPDKETVLTPWRVVNMQLGKTIGGYSYYDDDYRYTSKDGVPVRHWIDTDETASVFKPDARILEINSKTGLYPLYAATSLYSQAQSELNNYRAGKFTPEDEDNLWEKILQENIFVVAKTLMAKTITQRTLSGYRDYQTNIAYIDGIVETAKASIDAGVEKIEGAFANMKFDVVIGNPPYQEEVKGNGRSNPIYNLFMDMAIKVGEKVSLITPARFLFDAGQTPHEWNRKMLENNHFKVVYYNANSAEIFPRTDIKGGVAITFYDQRSEFTPVKIFTPYNELKTIMTKVDKRTKQSLSNIVYGGVAYRFAELVDREHPEVHNLMGNSFDLRSNSIDKLNNIVFLKDRPSDGFEYVQVLGLSDKKRSFRWIRRDYLKAPDNFEHYKVILPESNGSGALGEAISTPFIGQPFVGHTQTFISIGNLQTEAEAKALFKYVKSKFARVMLGILKITQHNPVSTWSKVPLQNFAPTSDMDWSKSAAEIDQQLYTKYGLSDAEIHFIESKVQEMK